MKRRIILATANSGKVTEIKKILKGIKFQIVSLADVNFNQKIIENKKSFAGNALLKARAVSKKFPQDIVIAEDSGICLKALNQAPGVKSARWAGKGASAEKIIRFTLNKIKQADSKSRSAYFECCAVIIIPNKPVKICRGKISGKITDLPLGKIHQTLPYDQIFIPWGYSKTFSQLPVSLKNKISHRYLVFVKIKQYLNIIDKKFKLNQY